VEAVVIGGSEACLVDDVVAVAGGARVELSGEALARIDAGREVVDRFVEGDRLIYGLNTLLGSGRNVRVPLEELVEYQLSMIDGHAGALGPPLPDADVRATMFVRALSAASGTSGLNRDSVRLLVEMLNRSVHPLVPEDGSIGASDLMHLAAIAMVMIGRGEARLDGEVVPGAQALSRAGLEPRQPLPKEGLALVSYNAASIGIAALVVAEAERVAHLCDRIAALSLEAYNGNPSVFREEVGRLKPIQGLIEAAAAIRAEIDGSYLHDAEVSVQNPLSFRTIPQVHGGLREQVRAAREATEVELRSSDDNPLVLVESGELFSAGNFQPVSLALAFEALRIGIAHAGLVSERRLVKLRWTHGQGPGGAADLGTEAQRQWFRGEPQSLAARRRLSSYAAVAILSKLKALAHPVTLDITSQSQDVEDHGTNAPATVLQTRESLRQLETILCVEALAAAALIERRGDLRLGAGTAKTYRLLKQRVDALDPAASTAEAVEAVRASMTELD
jgi:histidine ammonia-lyase